MKRAILILTILLGTALVAQAADENPPKKKSRRAKSTTRVITNEDVKKSRGKVIQLDEKPGTAEPAPQATLSERHTALRIARTAAEERVRAASDSVADLEKELARIERTYFEADDLDHRDQVITRQFATTRAKLDAARAELEAARTALASLPDRP